MGSGQGWIKIFRFQEFGLFSRAIGGPDDLQTGENMVSESKSDRSHRMGYRMGCIMDIYIQRPVRRLFH